MGPTFKDGEKIKVNEAIYKTSDPLRWDIAIFKYPINTNQLFAMRVVGLPVDTILFTNNNLIINNIELKRPEGLIHLEYKNPLSTELKYGVSFGCKIPVNNYFVIGDNSMHAYDSRFWGTVPREFIVGKADDSK